ncbi:hypothetical protein OG967_42905 [Streptomyces phaeochromogenes]
MNWCFVPTRDTPGPSPCSSTPPVDPWRTAHQAIAACLAEAGPDAGGSVAAVGPTGHGDGLYALDDRGLPARAAIVAMDTRADPVLGECWATPSCDSWPDGGTATRAKA